MTIYIYVCPPPHRFFHFSILLSLFMVCIITTTVSWLIIYSSRSSTLLRQIEPCFTRWLESRFQMDQNRLPGWYLWICLSRSWALPQNTAWNRTSILSHLNVWLIQSCCVGFLIILLFIFAYYYSVLKIILARLLRSLIMLWLGSISQQELNEALTPTLRWLSVLRLLTCLHFIVSTSLSFLYTPFSKSCY